MFELIVLIGVNDKRNSACNDKKQHKDTFHRTLLKTFFQGPVDIVVNRK